MQAATAGVLASLLKLLLPEPRPHFLAVCAKFGGTVVSSDVTINVASDCVDKSESDPIISSAVKEALRSFPSYHATIAVYRYTNVDRALTIC